MPPRLTRVPKSLRQAFWSLYGRRVWDAQHAATSRPVIERVAELLMANAAGSSWRVLDG